MDIILLADTDSFPSTILHIIGVGRTIHGTIIAGMIHGTIHGIIPGIPRITVGTDITLRTIIIHGIGGGIRLHPIIQIPEEEDARSVRDADERPI